MAKSDPMPRRLFDAHNHLSSDDPDGSKMIAHMDRDSVEAMVIMGLPFGSARQIRAFNEQTIRVSRAYPDRFVGGVYLDPRKGKKAIDELKRARERDIRLVKLFPNLGYYPDDRKVRPFFAAVAKLDMAVLSHCGWLWPQPGHDYASYYSHPGRFEKVVRLFPDTPFILAHMGGIAGFLETVMLTTRTPNTYVDCSPGQGRDVLRFAPKIAGSVPPEKLMWGSDGAYGAVSVAKYRRLLTRAGFGPHLKKVFYQNARGLFDKLGALKPEKNPRKRTRK